MSDQFLHADPTPPTGAGRRSFTGSPSLRSPSIPISARKQKICRSASFSVAKRDSGIGLSLRTDEGVGSPRRAPAPPAVTLTPVSPGNRDEVAASQSWDFCDEAILFLPPSPRVTPARSPTPCVRGRRRKSGVHLSTGAWEVIGDAAIVGDGSLRVPSGNKKPTSPSIPIPGKRHHCEGEADEWVPGYDGPSDEYEIGCDEVVDDAQEPSQFQFSLSCHEDDDGEPSERRPVIFVPSIPPLRPPLGGSLTSWHRPSFLQSSSSPSWPSSPARNVHPASTLPLNPDGNANSRVNSAVEADEDGGLNPSRPRLVRSDENLPDLIPRIDRRVSLPARFDVHHPMARHIGVELCRIADEIEALFITDDDGGADGAVQPGAAEAAASAHYADEAPTATRNGASSSAPSAFTRMSTLVRRFSDWSDRRRVNSENNTPRRGFEH